MHIHPKKASVLAIAVSNALVLAGFPMTIFAATPITPSCVVTAASPYGGTTTGVSSVITARMGDPVVLTWKATNATSVKNSAGSTVALSGTTTVTPTQDTTYTYTAKKSTKASSCSARVHVVSATLDTASVISQSQTPALTGTATGLISLRLDIAVSSTSASLVTVNSLPVINGTWKTVAMTTLPQGSYVVRLYSNATSTPLTTSALYVGTPPQGSVSAVNIPLLGGGTASIGGTVPVSYLQVRNIGTTTVILTGIKLQQNGTAQASALSGFSTVDDKGGSRGATTAVNFVSNVTRVPVSAVLAPGEKKLLTVKATIAPSTVNFGKTLQLNVVGFDGTIGSTQASFPIPGTTWTIGL